MKPYSGLVVGTDGIPYAVRYLLTDEEFATLSAVGALAAHTCEIIGMQDAVHQTTARFEVQAYLAQGGALQ